MSDQTGRKVPTGRLNRLARLGAWGVGTAGSAAVQGASAVMTGRKTSFSDLIMTPRSVQRLGEELARLRGAALKAGQMLSMDAGDFLPPELAELTDHLRDGVEPMAPHQLRRSLDRAWGPGWLKTFKRFSARPAASASIGQVHKAILKDDRVVAVKVQHPGVKESIDSDVDNVGVLVRMSGLAPKGINMAALLDEVRPSSMTRRIMSAKPTMPGATLRRLARTSASPSQASMPTDPARRSWCSTGLTVAVLSARPISRWQSGSASSEPSSI
jgi:predicted unusual protein kinase regulating ubiquinone biosynthesis (AarF/ABC1/UbiB family)